MKHNTNATFMSANAKCKISVCEPDFPLAYVALSKKVVVSINKPFQVAKHDFSKLSVIYDAVFAQQVAKEKLDEPKMLWIWRKRLSWL